jgi:hypothetical protein
MQTTHKISGDSADAYAAYLTSTFYRGDYYTGDGDERADTGAPVGGHSRWYGSPAMLAHLGLSPDEPVARDDLRALMRGVSPRDGTSFAPSGAAARASPASI